MYEDLNRYEFLNTNVECTFIVLSKEGGDTGVPEVSRMVGDVNLFMHDRDDRSNAEIDIMIAEKAYRGRGLAFDTVRMMMKFALENLQVTRFFAKIGAANSGSLALFRKLGYSEVAFVEAFQEYEFEYLCRDVPVVEIVSGVNYSTVEYGDEDGADDSSEQNAGDRSDT